MSTETKTEPRVKPLEWTEEFREGSYVRLRAETLIGLYEISSSFAVTTTKGLKVVPDMWRGPFTNAPVYAADLEEAKAGAQADFATRILGCIALSLSTKDMKK